MPTKTLTDEQIHQAHKLLDAIDKGGAERRRNFPIFAEDDYAAGAFTVMAAIGLWDAIPQGRILAMLRGESLKLGAGQHRPTDVERLKHYEQLAKAIRETNDWKPEGEIIYRQSGPNRGVQTVAWADGYGGWWIGFTYDTRREPEMGDSWDIQHITDEKVALAYFGLEEFPYDD